MTQNFKARPPEFTISAPHLFDLCQEVRRRSFLCYTVGSHYFIRSVNGVYVSTATLQFAPTPSFPPWFPYVYSLCLCVYFFFANKTICIIFLGFLGGASGKEPAYQCRRHKKCRFNPRVKKIPQRKPWQTTPVFLAGEFHGQRSLAGYTVHGVTKSQT